MRRLLVSSILVGLFAVPAMAVECVQSDGQPGVYIQGVGNPDDQCLTADEYVAVVSADALLDAELIADYVDHGDGTTTIDFGNGIKGLVKSDPLDRVIEANAGDGGPTVREWFARFGPR